MSEIPSVPVTTLAGLTSLSDLLSELPVSESLSNVASLNRTLLFHTLVASESKNLLSIRDDNLTRQLVHAIEQTNSDNIQLKQQYAVQVHGANISTYPELLQGIYNYRPTVFNSIQLSPALHVPHAHAHEGTIAQNKVIVGNSGTPTTQILFQQQQQAQQSPPPQPPPSGQSLQQPQQQQTQNSQSPCNTDRQIQQLPKTQHNELFNANNIPADSNSRYKNPQVSTPAVVNTNTVNAVDKTNHGTTPISNINSNNNNTTYNSNIPIEEISKTIPETAIAITPKTLETDTNEIIKYQQQPQQGQPQLQQRQQMQLQIQQQQQQQQQLQYNSTNIVSNAAIINNVANTNEIPHGIPVNNASNNKNNNINNNNNNSCNTPYNNVEINPHIKTATPTIQGNFQNVLNLQRHFIAQQQQLQKQLIAATTTSVTATSAAVLTTATIVNNNNKTISIQNNQSSANDCMTKITTTPTPSAQYNKLLPNIKIAKSKSQIRVCINRLKPEDVLQMQQSIKTFIQQSPDAAKKLGLLPAIKTPDATHNKTTMMAASATATAATTAAISTATTAPSISTATTAAALPQLKIMHHPPQPNDYLINSAPATNVTTTIPIIPVTNLDEIRSVTTVTTVASIAPPITTITPTTVICTPTATDTFTIMKANEKQSAVKRKLTISIDDIPPDQIFSKPKVRRVERVFQTHTPKCLKDDVLRSQTYQQFMRNMEQIIEQLDDTESPNFESDEIDHNIECIPSKLLNTMSNDVAKLKAKNVLDLISKNKLTLLINYAMRNIYLARNYSAGPDDDDDIIDEEIMEKILNGIESCLLVCNIYSTVNDLKFLQEDNISMIIKFMQFQLRETIFPSYDPVYTVKCMKKSDNRKKSKSYQMHSRNLHLLYSKVVELMKVFVTLFDKCIFVDTIVLPLSTLAIEPFFVDNIDTLQFVCLELVTTIFRKEQYDKIRSSILNDILASIDRLPSSKKNLRPFKLTNNSGNIQMVTALVLQLIQCATILPDILCTNNNNNSSSNNKTISTTESNDLSGAGEKKIHHTDVIVLKKYDVAISIGGNFLTTFLNKCKTRSNETDFRPLFENFIHDLLSTVNKPEWPASELLLSLLGTMLVRYVSNKSIEQSIRLVSLDYLGIVASRLRKDTVESRCKVNIIDSMIQSIKIEQEREGDLPALNNQFKLNPDEERTLFLQKVLLDFLAVNAQEENLIWDYARHFYLAQWYRDIIYQRKRFVEGAKGYASRKKLHKRKKQTKDELSGTSESDSCDESGDDGRLMGEPGTKNRNSNEIMDQELNLEIYHMLEERKKFLLSKIKPYNTCSNDLNTTAQQHIKTYIDYTNAHLIAQYLATKRPFSQSFDGYLKKIILVVNEPSIAIRTKAMKCLANIVEVDPFVLKRKDMQMGVNQKFLDAAISVREAAVDLVGKFVLSNEELIDQYYDMLSTRILDTGVSVRKRVIKILRDICIEYPDFKKIPEICVKMIRRVNDEEGIQKLVTEVFMKMWFNPCNKNDKHGVLRKINQIIDVVNTAHDTGTTWLEGLLNSIFQPKDNTLKGLDGGGSLEPIKKNTEPPQEIVLACQQLADGLVCRLIELEDTDNERMLGCITTLHLLAKVRPQLLVRHAITIEPYLNIKCHPSTAPKFICAVADILEKVVPLVNNASESFLASLEEHLMLLVVSLNQAVVSSCVSCLGAVVNKITKNYKLIRDCFQKFYRILDYSRNQIVQNNYSVSAVYTPMFRRSLFTIGILMRYFDFKAPYVIGDANSGGLPSNICDEAFERLMFFTQCSNYEIQKQALMALGSFCVMNDDYLIRPELKEFYCDILSSDIMEASIKKICMRNIWIYLTESEMHMYNKEKEWEKHSKTEDLKEMNDVSSGMASRIIQLYLKEILDCFLNRDDAVRLWAVKVVQIVLRQGLVHPVRMVPYLICLSTDIKLESAHRADALLKDIDKTYSGFVNMKVQFGLQLCFKLQEILQINNCNIKEKAGSSIIRGYIKRDADSMPAALNDFLYTLLRCTKPQRRALVQTVIKQFDDQKTHLRQMLYIADNLAYFPYVVQDEPLYLIHQIDLLISMAGTNILATFKECLKPGENTGDILEDDDDVEDPDVLYKRLPENTNEIEKCITSAQACMLLLVLKEHLKDMYSLTDSKISRYSPSETKLYEKAVNRKNVRDFNPKTTIDIIKKQQQQQHQQQQQQCNNVTVTVNATNEILTQGNNLSNAEKMDLVVKYLDFKQLMLKLDPDDLDSDEDPCDKSKLNNTTNSSSIYAGESGDGADTTTFSTTPTTSMLNTSSANQTFNESGVGTSGGTGAHLLNTSTPNCINKTRLHSTFAPPTTPTSIKNLSPTTTPSSTSSRFTKSVVIGIDQMKSPISQRKLSTQRSKRNIKAKIISSDDENDNNDHEQRSGKGDYA